MTTTTTLPDRVLLEGPADGHIVGIHPDKHDVVIPITPDPRRFATNWLDAHDQGPAYERHTYHQGQARAVGGHPCIRGLTVAIEATGYVHSGVGPGRRRELVQARGLRECTVRPSWWAAELEFRAIVAAGLLGYVVPAMAWALQADRELRT